jgi:hypothetical protein
VNEKKKKKKGTKSDNESLSPPLASCKMVGLGLAKFAKKYGCFYFSKQSSSFISLFPFTEML